MTSFMVAVDQHSDHQDSWKEAYPSAETVVDPVRFTLCSAVCRRLSLLDCRNLHKVVCLVLAGEGCPT